VHLQGVRLDQHPGPDACAQFVIRGELSGALDEYDEQIERAGADAQRGTVGEHLPFGRLQLEASEPVTRCRGCRCHQAV
jgi:hypothetical protein